MAPGRVRKAPQRVSQVPCKISKTPFELERDKRIEANNARLKELGLYHALSLPPKAKVKKLRQKQKENVSNLPRKLYGLRQRKTINYRDPASPARRYEHNMAATTVESEQIPTDEEIKQRHNACLQDLKRFVVGTLKVYSNVDKIVENLAEKNIWKDHLLKTAIDDTIKSILPEGAWRELKVLQESTKIPA
jgi:hypothetical protein